MSEVVDADTVSPGSAVGGFVTPFSVTLTVSPGATVLPLEDAAHRGRPRQGEAVSDLRAASGGGVVHRGVRHRGQAGSAGRLIVITLLVPDSPPLGEDVVNVIV